MGELRSQREIVLPDEEDPHLLFDIDGTLFKHPRGNDFSIGEPIPKMIEFLRQQLAAGWKVKIFTARWANPDTREEQEKLIRDALREHVSEQASQLEITNAKDLYTRAIYDDRAIQVIMDTGEIVCPY